MALQSRNRGQDEPPPLLFFSLSYSLWRTGIWAFFFFVLSASTRDSTWLHCMVLLHLIHPFVSYSFFDFRTTVYGMLQFEELRSLHLS